MVEKVRAFPHHFGSGAFHISLDQKLYLPALPVPSHAGVHAEREGDRVALAFSHCA